MSENILYGPELNPFEEMQLKMALSYPVVKYMGDMFQVTAGDTESGTIVNVVRIEDVGKNTRMVSFAWRKMEFDEDGNRNPGSINFVYDGEEGAGWAVAFLYDCDPIALSFDQIHKLEELKGEGVKVNYRDEIYSVDVTDDGIIKTLYALSEDKSTIIAMHYDPDLDFVVELPNKMLWKDFLEKCETI